MKRLTEITNENISLDRNSQIKCSNYCTNCGRAECDYIRNALRTLAEYEDTNLTPEQIKEFDKLYLEKCEEVNRQHKEIQILSGEVLRLKDHILELEEKRIPKKPIDISDSQHSEKIGTCPSCGQRNSIYKKFCIECGQAIDWSVEE